jgi:hypothetical protein
MSDEEIREELVASAERSERELQVAIEDLKQAVKQPFGIGERIAEHPLPWMVGGVLVGLWLGIRDD